MNVGAVVGILAALGLAAAMAGGGGSAPKGTAISRAGFKKIRELASLSGLSEDWQNFFIFVAYGESGGNNLVGLGNPALYPPWTVTNRRWIEKGRPALTNAQRNEAKAAARGYDNAPQIQCWDRTAYVFGSGGWFGFLPSTALSNVKNSPLRCQHPYTIFDPGASMVYAMAFARNLQGWEQWQNGPRTVLSLRAGWGWPAKMGDAAYLTAKRAKYAKQLNKIGLPASFLDKKLPRMGKISDPAALVRFLGGLIWLPEEDQA